MAQTDSHHNCTDRLALMTPVVTHKLGCKTRIQQQRGVAYNKPVRSARHQGDCETVWQHKWLQPNVLDEAVDPHLQPYAHTNQVSQPLIPSCQGETDIAQLASAGSYPRVREMKCDE